MAYKLSEEEFTMIQNDDLDMYLNHIVHHPNIETSKLHYRNMRHCDIFTLCYDLLALKIIKVLFLRGCCNTNINRLLDIYNNNTELRILSATEICRMINNGKYIIPNKDKIIYILGDIALMSNIPLEKAILEHWRGNYDLLPKSLRKVILVKPLVFIGMYFNNMDKLVIDSYNPPTKILLCGIKLNTLIIKNMNNPTVEINLLNMTLIKLVLINISVDNILLPDLVIFHAEKVKCNNIYNVHESSQIAINKIIFDNMVINDNQLVVFCDEYKMEEFCKNVKIFKNKKLIYEDSNNINIVDVYKGDQNITDIYGDYNRIICRFK